MNGIGTVSLTKAERLINTRRSYLKSSRNDGVTIGGGTIRIGGSHICGTLFEIDDLYDPCPYCDFEYEGFTDYTGMEDEKDSPSAPSYNEAKANFARGLTAYDEPLPKRGGNS